MFLIQLVILCAFAIVVTKEDWVEIPQVKSFDGPRKVSGTSFFSEVKTPMNVVIHTEQIENLESYNTTNIPNISKRILSDNAAPTKNTNRITTKPGKSSVMEIFSSSTSTTEFTPLMSSISIAMTSPVTTPMPVTRTTESRNLRRNKGKKKNKQNNHSDGIEIEDDPNDVTNDNVENREETEESPISYAGFMPFIRSIQSTLLQRAHKTIKSKIQILKNLRDNLLYDIDQRIKSLWSTEESSAREYKGDSHIEFPSNEGALMTIGFLTLAVFLVKLVLQVIAAIKAKKAYYSTTTTTAATTGRKKRFAPDNDIDEETTYRILNLIDTYKASSFDYN